MPSFLRGAIRYNDQVRAQVTKLTNPCVFDTKQSIVNGLNPGVSVSLTLESWFTNLEQTPLNRY